MNEELDKKIEEVLDLLDTGEVQWGQARLDAKQAIQALIAEARIDELESLRFCLDEESRKITHTKPEFKFGTVRERLAELQNQLKQSKGE